jgi:hypothetical protein
MLEYSFVHRKLVDSGMNVRIVLAPATDCAGGVTQPTDVPTIRRLFKKKEERSDPQLKQQKQQDEEDCLKNFVVSLCDGLEQPLRHVFDVADQASHRASSHDAILNLIHKLASMSVGSVPVREHQSTTGGHQTLSHAM